MASIATDDAIPPGGTSVLPTNAVLYLQEID
jgi:hypothetical protein